MNRVACNFCGSTDEREVYSLKDWLTKKPGDFRLVRCARCGLMYLNPQPTWEELEPYYPENYNSYMPPNRQARPSLMTGIIQAGWRRRRKAIETRVPGGKLLDIGCATGEFLAEMEQHAGWECFGVEPVAFAANLARQNTKAQIFEGTLQEARYPDQSFDVVTLWDVLEHIPDPVGVIRETHRILKPGGLLILRVPDPESFTGRLFGRHWVALDAPRHLYHFPRSMMKARLERENFHRVTSTSLSSEHFVFFGSLAIVFYQLRLAALGRFFEWVSNSPAARTLAAIFFLPFRWMGLGSSPVYFAWKA